MAFLDTVRSAKAYLEDQGRVSLTALRLEFDLDEARLQTLVEELVDVQQVASREGKALSWIGPASDVSGEPAESSTVAALRTQAHEAAASEAEHRQLTVMFCDLVGSTDLSHRLGAEELRDVVRAYQESTSSVIDRYEGYVAQYLGDGLLVYFGYPSAHEDDAGRAVRAGQETLTALARLNEELEPRYGVRLAARVGIHSGPVVVGEMGGRARSETLALGETTNIAARLVGVAAPGSVVISAATLRQVQGQFEIEDLGTPSLKGVAEPIRAYSVLRTTSVRSRLDVDSSKLVPFVGRAQELGLLLERFEQAQEGQGQAVLLSGEAGLGKSRLLRAFRERLAEIPHGWLECRCSPYTQGSAFHPLIELVEQGLRLEPGDEAESKLSRLEAGLSAAGLSPDEVVPLIAPLLSLPLPDRFSSPNLSPERKRQKTIEALVAWIIGLAESQPLVMLVEDLHWSDASTIELLGWLLEQAPTTQLLVLASFRPEFEPPWPARSHVTTLAVKRLSQRQARSLIHGVTRDTPVPEPLLERILERSDGVPLFVEELTKMVLESDLVEEREGRFELTGAATELEIPATLHGLLMARLDRLEEGKAVAQLGAALGREFVYEVLRAVSTTQEIEEGLAQLLDAELIYARGTPPRATYTFKHAMIQETAYQSLLKRVRQEFHGRIARVLAERFPERIASQPEVIARHYAEGGLVDEAITHYQRAGQQATERSANEEAIRHLRHALDLLASQPESVERNQRELRLQLAIAAPLSAARGWSDPQSEHAFARARELVSAIGDVPELPRVLVGLAVAYHIAGNLAVSTDLAGEALVAAERVGDTFDLLSARYAVACPLYWRGELSQALQHLERAIDLYDPEVHASRAYGVGIDRGVVCRNYAASTYMLRGYPDRALATAREAVALGKRVGHPLSLVTALAWEAWIHQLRREPGEALAPAEETVARSEAFGFPLFFDLGRILRGWAVTLSRGTAESIRRHAPALRRARRRQPEARKRWRCAGSGRPGAVDRGEAGHALPRCGALPPAGRDPGGSRRAPRVGDAPAALSRALARPAGTHARASRRDEPGPRVAAPGRSARGACAGRADPCLVHGRPGHPGSDRGEGAARGAAFRVDARRAREAAGLRLPTRPPARPAGAECYSLG
jgi:class 3 adenylate cyclase/tetratricopeptide (TPR) repeat protein